MTENQWATFSGQQLASAYALEAETLGALAQSAAFGDVVRYFGSYEDYLKRLHSDPVYQSSLDRIISDQGIVDVAVPSKELVLLFCQAQIAACTELSKGWGSSFFLRRAPLCARLPAQVYVQGPLVD